MERKREKPTTMATRSSCLRTAGAKSASEVAWYHRRGAIMRITWVSLLCCSLLLGAFWYYSPRLVVEERIDDDTPGIINDNTEVLTLQVRGDPKIQVVSDLHGM